MAEVIVFDWMETALAWWLIFAGITTVVAIIAHRIRIRKAWRRQKIKNPPLGGYLDSWINNRSMYS